MINSTIKDEGGALSVFSEGSTLNFTCKNVTF